MAEFTELERLYLQRTAELDQGWAGLVERLRALPDSERLGLLRYIQRGITTPPAACSGVAWTRALIGCAVVEVLKRSYEMDHPDTEADL